MADWEEVMQDDCVAGIHERESCQNLSVYMVKITRINIK